MVKIALFNQTLANKYEGLGTLKIVMNHKFTNAHNST